MIASSVICVTTKYSVEIQIRVGVEAPRIFIGGVAGFLALPCAFDHAHFSVIRIVDVTTNALPISVGFAGAGVPTLAKIGFDFNKRAAPVIGIPRGKVTQAESRPRGVELPISKPHWR